MKRYLALALAISTITAATLSAQAPGWKQRIDRSTNASDPDPAGEVKFMAMAGGFHTANPSAAIFWNPKNTATGNYTLKATFAQNQRSSHPNFLGLMFGGKDLDGPNQNYTYFLVAPQAGTWIINRWSALRRRMSFRGARVPRLCSSTRRARRPTRSKFALPRTRSITW
jgi:hypothetical protein